MMILDLVFGFLLVLAGRKLFWLCVGIVGFLIGVQYAASLGISDGWTALVSAFALGSVGIVLAVSFEWAAVVGGAGFLGGGYLLMNLFHSAAGQELSAWPVFVLGGIVGACLMVIIFDWTLIVISSLLGATLIVNAFHAAGGLRESLWIGCAVVGIAVQYYTLMSRPTKDTSRQKRSANRPARR